MSEPTDVLFFLKSVPTQALRDLPWPRPTKFISVDPDLSICDGIDPRCSTAYVALWNRYGSLQRFIDAWTSSIENVGRVGFVAFSAAHGFLDPALRSPEDRALVDALILLDASFGLAEKPGYIDALEDSADNGRPLIVSTTSNSGGTESWEIQWAAAGLPLDPNAPAEAPVPEPGGGVAEEGGAVWLNWTNPDGGTDLIHPRQHEILEALAEAYLIPYWTTGELPDETSSGVGAGTFFVAAALLAPLLFRPH